MGYQSDLSDSGPILLRPLLFIYGLKAQWPAPKTARSGIVGGRVGMVLAVAVAFSTGLDGMSAGAATCCLNLVWS